MYHAADYLFFLSLQEGFDNSSPLLILFNNVARAQGFKFICISSEFFSGPRGFPQKNLQNLGSTQLQGGPRVSDPN
jgi:hypothetical protein